MAALIVLGLAVGKGSTPLDDWFHATHEAHPELGWLLVFSDAHVTVGLGVILLLATLFLGRWRLAAVVGVTPLVGVVVARLAKQAFGRRNEGALAYPSGHTTLMVVVLGLAVMVVGAATWTVIAAAVVAMLGVLGQGFTYHYFTDAIGAVFLGTAVVCLAAWGAGLDRCQPRCDLRHSGR